MIPDQWYAIAESTEVPRNRPVGLLRLGERIVLWRGRDGTVSCARDRCVHRGVALSAGRIAEDHLECPFHGFRYDAKGACKLIPALGRESEVPKRFRLRTYPARDQHGFIWIYWAKTVPDELPAVPFFDDLDESFSRTTFRDPWPVHYSRAIENQLDVMHLPFVHRTTIGRGGRTVVDGPIVEWRGKDAFRFYVHNRKDDGGSARAADEIDSSEASVYLDFQFPNIWQNSLSDSMRVMAAFAPVDEGNTMIYLRFYQKMVRVPLLRELFDLVMMQVNKIILGQDKRVVITQQPSKSSLKMGENLVAGDAPIVAYRRRRHELQAGQDED